MNFGQNQFKDF